MLKGRKPVWLEKYEQGWSITFKGNRSDSMKICVLKVESLNLNYVIYSNIQIIDVNFTENMIMIIHSIFHISISIKHLLFWSLLYFFMLFYIFTISLQKWYISLLKEEQMPDTHFLDCEDWFQWDCPAWPWLPFAFMFFS